MEFVRIFNAFEFLLLGFMAQHAVVMGSNGLPNCHFPSIYNFGDSNSDTGGLSATLMEVTPPNGESFFGHPAGRFCDGRLIIDLIAERLKLPYLSSYMDSIGTAFRQGANFAYGGSSILSGVYNPFTLSVQVTQYGHFKHRSVSVYHSLSAKVKASPSARSKLARPQDFSKAIYTIDIGQNDLAYGFLKKTGEAVQASIPNMINQFGQAVMNLFEQGARVFWVHNTGPIGCLPFNIRSYESKHGSVDKNGCVDIQNQVAQEFNRQLKVKISQLRKGLPSASFTYVDMYSAKFDLITHAKSEGFTDPKKFCCGTYQRYSVNCGMALIVNGTTGDHVCSHPSKYISWDGIHYTEAANVWLADRILNGTYSDPPVPISMACYHSDVW